jgi:hypothetical protein
VRRPWTRLSDEPRRDVVAHCEACEPSTVLVDQFDVTKSTILGVLRADHVVVRRQSLKAASVTEAARLYEAGLSLSEIAARLEINQ